MSRVFSKKPVSDRVRDDEVGDAGLVPVTDQQVWNKALALQGRRDHSRLELTQKLLRLGASAEQVDAALLRLVEYALQSDDRYAESLVRSQLLRGRGQRAIRQVLQQRGLDALHPALAEQTVDTDWAAQAQALLHRRFGSRLSQDAKDKARYVRFLQYRGYSMEQAITAIRAGQQASTDEFEP